MLAELSREEGAWTQYMPMLIKRHDGGVSLDHVELIDICQQLTGRRIHSGTRHQDSSGAAPLPNPQSGTSWPSPERVQVFEPTNMLPELRFMISNAPLMPTEHDAASPIDCTDIVNGLF